MTPAPRGFILATSLLVLALLTVMLTAAFVMVSAESRTTDNAAASARALAVAEAGLQNYLSLNRGLFATNSYDSTRLTVTGGYADVVAQRIRTIAGGTPSLWSIRSTGYPSDAMLTGTPAGKRTVARLAHLYPGQLPARSAMIALNGVQITGTIGDFNPFDGSDMVGAQSCSGWPGTPASDSFALSIFRGAAQYLLPSGFTDAPSSRGVDSVPFASRNDLYDTTHINWPAVVDTTFANFTPDYVLPGGSLPPPLTTSNYTVGYAPNDYVMPGWTNSRNSPRRGVLVVGGNLTMSNNTHWDGALLVGGRLIIPASATNMIIDGQVVTGLNYYKSTPVAVPANQIPRSADLGDFRIAWSWCYATVAAQSLSGFGPVRRFWTDGWALY